MMMSMKGVGQHSAHFIMVEISVSALGVLTYCCCLRMFRIFSFCISACEVIVPPAAGVRALVSFVGAARKDTPRCRMAHRFSPLMFPNRI